MDGELLWREDWQPECVARHLGLWLIERDWFERAVRMVAAGVWMPIQNRAIRLAADQAQPSAAASAPRREPSYFVDGSGMAIIGIEGQMQKGESKFEGANTIAIRRQVRAATKDPDVNGIFLAIDSPGGHVAGTQELAADVAEANLLKPTFAHVDDMGASAAYWVASQTRRITASPTSEVGSIGVVAVVEDSSAMAEKRGIKVHVISTGPFKGAGIDGAPVTDDQIGYVQERVDAINEHFIEAVSSGRQQSLSTVKKWASGKVWIADVARDMGLIDGVMRMDDALQDARLEILKLEEDTGGPRAKVTIRGNTVTGTAACGIYVEDPNDPAREQVLKLTADRRVRVIRAIQAREEAEKRLKRKGR